MATLYKKRGWWFIEYSLGGKRITKNTKLEATISNKVKAEKLKSDIEDVIDEQYRSTQVIGSQSNMDVTLNQATKRYAAIYMAGRSTSHKNNFQLILDRFKNIFPGTGLVRDIKVEHVNQFAVNMKRSLSQASQVTYFQYLASFLTYLKEADFIEQVPLGKGIRPKKAVKNIISFDPADLALILEEAKARGEIYYKAFMMFLLTGQRPGDVLRLQVRDIDFHRKIIYFRVSKTASEFKFPLYSKLEAYLKDEMDLSDSVDKDGYLFKGLTVCAVGQIFRKIKSKLGFHKRHYYTLKTFRKNFATNMSRLGMTIQDVQALLDHKSPSTTLRYYADVKAEELKNKMDKLLG